MLNDFMINIKIVKHSLVHSIITVFLLFINNVLFYSTHTCRVVETVASLYEISSVKITYLALLKSY